MNVKELIERLNEVSEDAEVIFYNRLRSDDLSFNSIGIAEDDTEIYINLVG